MIKLFIIGIGGFFGAIARYGLSGYVHKHLGAAFPYGTLAVNVLGCLLIGAFMYFVEGRAVISSNLRLFIGIGLLGAFTTFSTFGYETAALIGERNFLYAAASIIGNVTIGLIAVWLGRMIPELIGL